jgi:hypothetical protein
VWIEHHPPLSADRDTETFDLVDLRLGGLLQLRGEGEAPYIAETRLSLGEAPWKRITRDMVETLVGAKV